MSAVSESIRVSKEEWYDAGGFANPKCWRKQGRSGGWKYYILL